MSRNNRIGCERMDWFKIGEGVSQGCILSSCLFNTRQNTKLNEAQAGIKFAWRNINNIIHANPYGRKLRETKESLGEGER